MEKNRGEVESERSKRRKMTEKKKTGHDDSADLRKQAEEALRESEALLREASSGTYWPLGTRYIHHDTRMV